MPPIPVNRRDENLQILRFVAAALVLVTHVTFYIGERVQPGFAVWNGGEAGVPIFFLISGFVMFLSGSRLSRDGDGAAEFMRRRVARVFPMYWLMTSLKVAIALLVPATVLHNHPDALSIAGSYVLFPMLNGEGEVRPLHGVGWTLLHEMFFYYVFALGLWLRRSPFAFSSAALGLIWALGFVLPHDSALARVVFSDLNLLFVAGMALAAVYQQNRRLPIWLALALLAAAIAMLSVPTLRELQGVWLGRFNLGAILLVGSLLSIQVTALPALRALLVKLGDSSYSLYMIHPILAPALCVVLAKAHLPSPYLVLAITVVACVAIAHFVYRLVERPLNRAAARLFELGPLAVLRSGGAG